MPYKDPDKEREFQRVWANARRRNYLEKIGCARCGSHERLGIKRTQPGVSKPMFSGKDNLIDQAMRNFIVLCKPCAKDISAITHSISSHQAQPLTIMNWERVPHLIELLMPHQRRTFNALERKGIITSRGREYILTKDGEILRLVLPGRRHIAKMRL